MKLTDRQSNILKHIVEDYIETGIPVGSKNLIAKYGLDVSSATIRNEMAALEKAGLLEKSHTSSGRIPSTNGYKWYAKESEEKSLAPIENKLQDIFAKRRVSIDLTLDEAAKAISDIAGITLVTSSQEANELLKSITLTPLSDKAATVVLVTSSGKVEHKTIEIGGPIKIDDIRVAVRIFKERLVDTPLKELSIKTETLIPIIAKSVKNYEELIKMFVGKVFDYHNKMTNKVYGNSNIIKSNDINREELAKLIDLIEHKSVWESIEGEIDDDENIKISVNDNNTSLVSKKIETSVGSKEISVVGSNRMQYKEVKSIMKLLERFFKKEGDE